MSRFTAFASIVLLLATLAGCAAEPRSGASASSAARSSDRLQPADDFPQRRGPYTSQ